jgi:hypothetical protein
MEMGKGYAVYVFNRNTFGDVESAVWPKVLTSTRKPNLTAQNIALNFTAGREFSGYNLLGNPYPFPIDMEASTGITRNGVTGAHYIYRAETGSYATHINGLTSLNGGSRYVAPYQGFWAVATTTESVFGLSRESRRPGEAVPFLKQAQQEGLLRLSLTNGVKSDETAIRIADKPLGFDVVQMEAMSADFAFVYSVNTSGKKLDLFEVDRNALRSEIPLRIQASASDSLLLTWPEMKNLPDNWDAVLLIDGEIIDLKKQSSWLFKNGSRAKAVAPADSLTSNGPMHTAATANLLKNATLMLGNGVLTSLEQSSERPQAFTVRPNYPNPFNPSTTLRFGLADAGRVSVQVFDLTGRKVADVMNGNLAAGWHQVSFNASRLSSGTYIVRFQSGNQVLNQKITLIK